MRRVDVELNFFYMHYNDARKFADWSVEYADGETNPSIYVRHSIISVVFAAEALINRVLAEFSVDQQVSGILERNGIIEKWCMAPMVCGDRSKDVRPFDRGSEPFQSFQELIRIRNWLAHPKVDMYLEASLDTKSSVRDSESGEEYPWLEMLRGKVWAQTEIPKNPFEVRSEHANAAIRVLDQMIEALSEKLDGRVDERWLEVITVRDSDGAHSYRVPVSSIWGGYGGAG